MQDTLFAMPEEQPRPKTELEQRGKPRRLQANRQQVEFRVASLDDLLPEAQRVRRVIVVVCLGP